MAVKKEAAAEAPKVTDRLGILRNDHSRVTPLPRLDGATLVADPDGTGGSVLTLTDAGNGGHAVYAIAILTNNKREVIDPIIWDGGEAELRFPWPVKELHLFNRLDGAGRQDHVIKAEKETTK